MFMKMFFGRLIEDFQYKELIPLKIVFFIHASTVLVLYPYLTIHMRELGINVRETAIMSAVTPVVAIVMPPVAGMIADRIGNFKLMLASLSTLVGPLALLLLLVPVGRLTVTYPENLMIDLSCNNQNLIMGIDEKNYSCIPTHPYEFEITGQIQACGLSCDILDTTNLNNILSTHTIQVTKNNFSTIEFYSHRYDEESLETLKVNTKLLNNVLYKETVRLISKSMVFFPLANLNFGCNPVSETNTTCGFSTNGTESFGTKIFRGKIIPQDLKREGNVNNLMGSSPLTSWRETQTDVQRFPICNTEDIQQMKIVIHPPGSTPMELNGCHPRCVATTSRKVMCQNLKEVQERNVQLTFWMYLSIRVLIGIVGGTTFAMFEGAVIAILREHKADYGLQRVYAAIGGMISSPLSGWLIDWASRGKDYSDFRPAFYLYAILKVATGILLLNIRLDFKAPATNVVTDFKAVLRNPEMIALLAACFILGTAWGYIESFLFWLIQDLGGSKSLMGITITVGGIFGIPLLILSGPIIDKIGHANVLVVGMVFYGVRLLGYSLIYNPWLCLIFEAMESVTTGLAFTAAVTYAAKLSTTSTDTSIQGLLGGLYFGVGKGSGSLIGGFLISAIGSRPTYQVFAAFTAATGLFYFLFNRFYLRKHSTEGNEIMGKKPPKAIKDKISDKDTALKIMAVENAIPIPVDTKENPESIPETTNSNTESNTNLQNSTDSQNSVPEKQGEVNSSFQQDSETQSIPKGVVTS